MKISEYQKDCFNNYKTSIGYPKEYTYLAGTPINVLVPIETAQEKVMIVGAYPSAKFYTINGVSDTPMADNDSPFSNESYFDGSRVRTIPSGKELNDVILSRIGVKRSECWVTDLVKVFLFKEGHIKRYRKLGFEEISENRSLFEEYANKSLPWLIKEIEIANPYVIILLGLEVTKVLFKVTDNVAKSYLDGKVRQIDYEGLTRDFICLPHPGILMKKTIKNPWPERFEKEISIEARKEIEEIKKARR
jgi:uracil-DNA glycosylase